jgi:hypothetical protein
VLLVEEKWRARVLCCCGLAVRYGFQASGQLASALFLHLFMYDFQA